MSILVQSSFTLASGRGIAVVLRGAEDTDVVGFRYSPVIGQTDVANMVILMDANGAVKLSNANPMRVLVLPGTYLPVVLSDDLSANAAVDMSDGGGFAVQLVVEAKNVAA